jgi:hypothetical protein
MFVKNKSQMCIKMHEIHGTPGFYAKQISGTHTEALFPKPITNMYSTKRSLQLHVPYPAN